MPLLLLRRGAGAFCLVGGSVAFAGRDLGQALHRARDAAQRRAEIGKVDEREQQAGDPEDVLMREQRQRPSTATISNCSFCDPCAIRSGNVCRRRNRFPTPSTAAIRKIAMTTIRTSVSPGAVMNPGRWWGAAG